VRSEFCIKTRTEARNSPFDVPDHPTLFKTLEVRSQINFSLIPSAPSGGRRSLTLDLFDVHA
jgi:hypothetical protein